MGGPSIMAISRFRQSSGQLGGTLVDTACQTNENRGALVDLTQSFRSLPINANKNELKLEVESELSKRGALSLWRAVLGGVFGGRSQDLVHVVLSLWRMGCDQRRVDKSGEWANMDGQR